MITHSLLDTFHMAQARGGVIQAWVVLSLAARPQTVATSSRTSHRTLTSFITRAWWGMGTKDSNSDMGKVGPCTEAQPVKTIKTPIEAPTTPRRNALVITLLTEIIIFYPLNHQKHQ
jgi:hypothetical protein